MVRVPRFDLDGMEHDADAQTATADASAKMSHPKTWTHQADASLSKAVRLVSSGSGNGYSCGPFGDSNTDLSANPSSEQPANEPDVKIEALNAEIRERLRALKERSMASSKGQDVPFKCGGVRSGTGRLVNSPVTTQGLQASVRPAAGKPKNLDLGSGGKAVLRSCIVSSTPPPTSSPLVPGLDKGDKYNSPRPLSPASVKHVTPHVATPQSLPSTVDRQELPLFFRDPEEHLKRQGETRLTLFYQVSSLKQELEWKKETIEALKAENAALRSAGPHANGWDRANLKQALESVTALAKAATDQKNDKNSLEKALNSNIEALRKDFERVERLEVQVKSVADEQDAQKQAMKEIKSETSAQNVEWNARVDGVVHDQELQKGNTTQQISSAVEDTKMQLRDAKEALEDEITSLINELKEQKQYSKSAIVNMTTEVRAETKALGDQVYSTADNQGVENQQTKLAIHEMKAELEKIGSRVNAAEKETRETKAALDDVSLQLRNSARQTKNATAKLVDALRKVDSPEQASHASDKNNEPKSSDGASKCEQTATASPPTDNSAPNTAKDDVSETEIARFLRSCNDLDMMRSFYGGN